MSTVSYCLSLPFLLHKSATRPIFAPRAKASYLGPGAQVRWWASRRVEECRVSSAADRAPCAASPCGRAPRMHRWCRELVPWPRPNQNHEIHMQHATETQERVSDRIVPDYIRSSRNRTWPDLGTQIRPNTELEPDLRRNCFRITEQYAWWN